MVNFLNYFEEYNSKPYQKYALKPIHALYDFAEDDRVKRHAKALLDLVSAFHAIRSHDMREFPPFRRQPGNERHNQFLRGFSDVHRLAVLVGNHQIIDFSI